MLLQSFNCYSHKQGMDAVYNYNYMYIAQFPHLHSSSKSKIITGTCVGPGDVEGSREELVELVAIVWFAVAYSKQTGMSLF